MRHYDDAAIEAKVRELWQDGAPDKIEIARTGKTVRIKLSSMYEAPGLSFAQLKALSAFFETDNLDDDDRFSYSGCETCDYGSSYGFTLRIEP